MAPGTREYINRLCSLPWPGAQASPGVSRAHGQHITGESRKHPPPRSCSSLSQARRSRKGGAQSSLSTPTTVPGMPTNIIILKGHPRVLHVHLIFEFSQQSCRMGEEVPCPGPHTTHRPAAPCCGSGLHSCWLNAPSSCDPVKQASPNHCFKGDFMEELVKMFCLHITHPHHTE